MPQLVLGLYSGQRARVTVLPTVVGDCRLQATPRVGRRSPHSGKALDQAPSNLIGFNSFQGVISTSAQVVRVQKQALVH